MPHFSKVNRLVWLPFLFSVCACADEGTDRTAITRTVAALNEFPQRTDLFTAGTDARIVLAQLWPLQGLVYRVPSHSVDGVSASAPDYPTVIISNEPWGEAHLNLPGMGSTVTGDRTNPRIASGNIRFITPDVALAEGNCTYEYRNIPVQKVPLLFDEEGWERLEDCLSPDIGVGPDATGIRNSR